MTDTSRSIKADNTSKNVTYQSLSYMGVNCAKGLL